MDEIFGREMSISDQLFDVLKGQFPKADIPEIERVFTDEFIDDPRSLEIVDRQLECETLDCIDRQLQLAHAALARLHPRVRQALETQFRENSVDRLRFAKGTTLVSPKDPYSRGSMLSEALSSARYSLTGIWPVDPDYKNSTMRQPSAIEAAKATVASLPQATPRSRTMETWSKVKLVMHAIRCWRLYGKEEPKIGGKKFLDFLQLFADTLDPEQKRKWDAGKLVRTFRYSNSKLKNGNKFAKNL